MTGQKRTGPAAKVTKHANVNRNASKHLEGLLLAQEKLVMM
jgi:hypothetical protein